MAPVILLTARNACSIAAHIAFAEAGFAFERRVIDLVAGEQRSADYLAMNPKGRVPVAIDDDFVLTEVPAILRYAALKAPEARLWPDAAEDDARCQEWLAWICSSVHPAYAHLRRPYRYADDEAARVEVSRKGRESCGEFWDQIEKKLEGRDFAVRSKFSVADAYLMVMWIWGRGPALGFDMNERFPHWTSHARRVAERPAVRRALALEEIETP